MKKIIVVLLLLVSSHAFVYAIVNPRVLPGSIAHDEVVLFWEKSPNDITGTVYRVFVDGKEKVATSASNYKITGLLPSTKYNIVIKSLTPSGVESTSKRVALTTKSKPAKLIDVTATPYNAKGDNLTLNTNALQKAIDDCPANGIVFIPNGTYITGALFVKKSNISLQLDSGATLKADHSLSSFPMVKTRYEGRERLAYASVLNIGSINGNVRCKNIRVFGGGTIDNQGSILADLQTRTRSRSDRSHGLPIINCDNVAIDNITITNPCTWNIHPIYCNGFTTYNCRILSNGMGLSNADGWNPDSSRDCYLINSTLETHDDHVAIKSGTDAEGRKIGIPSENIYVSFCHFKQGGGIAVGSEMSGGVRNVWFSDCTIESSDRGFHVKSRPGRGGVIEDIYFQNIVVEKTGRWGISVDMWYYVDNHVYNSRPVEELPVFRNIFFKDILIKKVTGDPILIAGLQESPIKNVVFKNVIIEDSEGGKILLRNCNYITFENVQISDKYWVKDNAHNISVDSKTSSEKQLNYEYTLVDNNATFSTKALFKNLMEVMESGRFYFGQQDATSSGYGWNDDSGKSDIYTLTGKLPAFYSWDYMDFTRPKTDNSKAENKIRKLTAKAFYEGGVNSYCWHFWNPVTNGSFYDTTVVVVPQLLPGGVFHEKYKRELERIAHYNSTLIGKYGEQIPIIFRPFHEFDGSWFWWGANHCTPEEFKKLYRFTVHYLRDILGVRNFLYAFSPDCKFHTIEEYLLRYPGDDYVDILAMDNYWDFRFDKNLLDDAHKKLAIISKYAQDRNKLAALTETGQSKIENPRWFTQCLMKVIYDYPQEIKLAYVAVWRNSLKGYYIPYKGHSAETDFLEFIRDHRVLMGDDKSLKNIYNM